MLLPVRRNLLLTIGLARASALAWRGLAGTPHAEPLFDRAAGWLGDTSGGDPLAFKGAAT
jgi:hypothetical protein